MSEARGYKLAGFLKSDNHTTIHDTPAGQLLLVTHCDNCKKCEVPVKELQKGGISPRYFTCGPCKGGCKFSGIYRTSTYGKVQDSEPSTILYVKPKPIVKTYPFPIDGTIGEYTASLIEDVDPAALPPFHGCPSVDHDLYDQDDPLLGGYTPASSLSCAYKRVLTSEERKPPEDLASKIALRIIKDNERRDRLMKGDIPF
jgi:hypothetical protein